MGPRSSVVTANVCVDGRKIPKTVQRPFKMPRRVTA